jgi:glyoxylase-like metal-dependent hydrolase (beta-lactamase superfamily II)
LTDAFLKTHGIPAGELPPPEVELTVPQNLFGHKPDVFLHGGENIQAGQYNLRVINTPGHTMGHVVYYEPVKKFMFSGDMLLPTIATNPAVHVQHIRDPLKQYIDSLLKLKAVDIDLVLPGHEDVFFHPRPRINEMIRDNNQKTEVIRRTFDDGRAKTAYEVSRILSKSARSGESYWNKFAGWDRRFAVLQSVAHLESLKFAGELNLEVKNSLNYYRPVNLRPPCHNIP